MKKKCKLGNKPFEKEECFTSFSCKALNGGYRALKMLFRVFVFLSFLLSQLTLVNDNLRYMLTRFSKKGQLNKSLIKSKSNEIFHQKHLRMYKTYMKTHRKSQNQMCFEEKKTNVEDSDCKIILMASSWTNYWTRQAPGMFPVLHNPHF